MTPCPHSWTEPPECPQCIRDEREKLKDDLENCHQQDRLKTNEINVLVKENRAQTTELQRLKDENRQLTASHQICVGAAGIGDASELCGWIDEKKAELQRLRACCAEKHQAMEMVDYLISSHYVSRMTIEAWNKAKSSTCGTALLEELNKLRAARNIPRMYPIQRGPMVPWSVMAPHEAMCQKNHGQSIQRIAERGGFGPEEAWAVVNGIVLNGMETKETWQDYKQKWFEYAERINNHYDELAALRSFKAKHES